MSETLQQVMGMLAIAMMVAMLARRLRLPYTIGLVLVGGLLAWSGTRRLPPLTSELLYYLILPPLLFEAALALRWRDLRRDLAPILSLAVFGTVAAMAVVAAAVHYLMGWPLAAALVFGALISATDPVAIIAMFKDNGVHGRLRVLVEAESLLNDAAAAVLFALALAFALAGADGLTGAQMSWELFRIVGGGALIGAGFGVAVIFAARGTSEHLVELTLTMLAAYGSFLLAEHFHDSGVLAAVTAGLIIGNFRPASEKGDFLTEKGREFMTDFWDFAAFLANSMVFLLIGARVAGSSYAHYPWTEYAGVLAITLFARAVAVYPLSALFSRSRWRISQGEQFVLWWGGLRGALALALVLSLPSRVPLRDEIVLVTFFVVAFSIVVQGLTMPPVLRKLGFLGGKHDEDHAHQ
ncbi:CPA1 family monovalent cation:H+ antiporter [Rhodoblastus acidophilus]|uniref:cation:proton antiporter n=1 Tax=Rhodoblastus acidophilus TaxID=1074 RepID=UPI002224EEAA|nr:sodium:proton antiporter [Rhodoblastus acidophilus]MCW2283962.1 CPA1 family monovalent cation:H+ antiporter [Rhodoblastus acidophilus]MCW2332658.1 CPA1 family monovalent cation:H+ antiporter [Rhodoblastus acidophilus]